VAKQNKGVVFFNIPNNTLILLLPGYSTYVIKVFRVMLTKLLSSSAKINWRMQ